MRIIFLSFCLILITFSGQSQVTVHRGSHHLFTAPKYNVYAVQTGNQQVDEILQKSIGNWKFTDISVINKEKQKELESDNSNYFLLITFIKRIPGEKFAQVYTPGANDLDDSLSCVMYLYQGDATINKNLIAFDWGECRFITSYALAQMPLLISQFSQTIAEWMQVNNDNEIKIRKSLSKDVSILQNKTLLICKDNLDKNFDVDLKNYSYKYEVKSLNDITKIMEENNPKYCLLFFQYGDPHEPTFQNASPIRTFVIYDFSSSKVIYQPYSDDYSHKIQLNLLNKAIKNSE